MSARKVEKAQEPRLLPVAELDGKEFLVDVENRQFRNFKDPDAVIGMHSEQGKKMVKDMRGSEWRCHGLSKGTTDKAEV
ncbi:MAG: hypothetical protein ACYSUD_10645 [Planctomycetota bacterium]|jgi:hypothetical protein